MEFVGVEFDDRLVESVLRELAKRNILSVIIEGGAQWLQTVIDSGLWDEARVERGPHSEKLGVEPGQKGVKAPNLDSVFLDRMT